MMGSQAPLYKSPMSGAVRKGGKKGKFAGLIKAISKNTKMSAETKKKAIAKLRAKM